MHRAADPQPQPEPQPEGAVENPFDVSRSPIRHLLQAKGRQADREASNSTSRLATGARSPPGDIGDGSRATVDSRELREKRYDAPTGRGDSADKTAVHEQEQGLALQDGNLAAHASAQDSGKGDIPPSGEEQGQAKPTSAARVEDDVGKDGEPSDTRGTAHNTARAAHHDSAAASTTAKRRPGQDLDTTGVGSYPASRAVQHAHPSRQGSGKSRPSSPSAHGPGSSTAGSGTVTASVDDLLRLLNAARQGKGGGGDGDGGGDGHGHGSDGPNGRAAANAGQQRSGRFQGYTGTPPAAPAPPAGPPLAETALHAASGHTAPSRRSAGSVWRLPPAGTPPSAPPADYASKGVTKGLAGVLLRQQALLAKLESQAAGKQAQDDIGLPTVRSTRGPNDDLLGLLRVRIDGSRVVSVD